MSAAAISFPEDTIECARGNYILRKLKDDRWQAFLVEDIVLLRRLVTLKLGSPIELIEEVHFQRSEPIEGMNDIHFLVTSFPEEFDSTQEAKDAIDRLKLVQGIQGMCINIKYFSKVNSLVYQPSDGFELN